MSRKNPSSSGSIGTHFFSLIFCNVSLYFSPNVARAGTVLKVESGDNVTVVTYSDAMKVLFFLLFLPRTVSCSDYEIPTCTCPRRLLPVYRTTEQRQYRLIADDS